MAVARCGHAVVVRNRRTFEGPEVGKVKRRRVSVKGPDPVLAGGTRIARAGGFGGTRDTGEVHWDGGSGLRGHKRKLCEDPISRDPGFPDGLQWPG